MGDAPPDRANADVLSAAAEATRLSAWRDGDYLVVRSRRASLPDRCLICNAPVGNGRLKITLFRALTRLEFWFCVIFFGMFILFLLAIRPKAVVNVPLCPTHRALEKRSRRAGLTFLLGGLTLIFASWILARKMPGVSDIFLVASLFVIPIGIMVHLASSRLLRRKKVDAHFAWIENVSPEILADLPEAS